MAYCPAFAGRLDQGPRDVRMMKMLEPQCDNLCRIFSPKELEVAVFRHG